MRSASLVASSSARVASDLAEADDDADVETPVDPRYEDLWVSAEGSLQLPDLASIDLDFDEHEE